MDDPLKHFMKRNDLEPVIRRTIKNRKTGFPEDLTGATVKFFMNETDLTTVKIDAAAVIESPASSGVVRYDWQGTDTDTADTYKAEFQIILASGKPITFPPADEEPGKSYITVLIGPDLGD